MSVSPEYTALFAQARPYQRDGALFALSAFSGDKDTDNPDNTDTQDTTKRHPMLIDRRPTRIDRRGVMLADDPGLGKSLEALLVAAGVGARRVLCIAPLVARVAWREMIRKHAPEWLRWLIMPPFDEMPGDEVIQDHAFLVLSYDVFSHPRTTKRWIPALRVRRWDLLILDEAHYLKSQSARTRAIYGSPSGKPIGELGVQATADRVLLLTGTPCPNHAAELFPHYNRFWRDLLTHAGEPLGQTDFEERYTKYVDGPWGRQIQGSQGQDQLRAAFAPVILRRRRVEVLPDLPPLTVQDAPLIPGRTVVVSLDIRADYERLMALPLGELLPVLTDAVVSLSALRRLLGAAKIGPAADWVRERLTLGVDKILVFAWHSIVIDGLVERLMDYAPVVVTGDTPEKGRIAAVERFQNDPSCRVFIGQTRAAGTAITLTRAAEVAIVEPSWTPSDNEQAIARAWRMGQTNPVLASFLYLPHSLDQRVMRAFRRKASELAGLYAVSGVTPETAPATP